ncbi:hypothetical protein YC2023_052921 [Brassica napus]
MKYAVWDFDDEEDPIVDNLMSLLEQQFPFNKSSFTGGATNLEVNRMREDAKTEAINRKTVKPKQTKQTTTSEVIDCESIASMVRDKVREDLSRIERQLSTLSESFITFQTNVLESIQQLVRKLELALQCRLDLSKVARDGQHLDIRRTSLHRVGIHTESAENDIINDAIRLANQTTSLTVDGLNGGQGIQLDVPCENQTPLVIPEKMVSHDTILANQTTSSTYDGLIGGQVIQQVIHTENQTRRDSHEEMITDDLPVAILFSNQANTFAVDVLNGAQEIQSSIHTDYQTLRGGAQKSGAEDMVASNPSASLVVDNPPPQYPLGREGKVADHRQSSPDMNLDPELLFTKPTFSLGLTQEERPHRKETVTEGVSMCENDVDHSQSSPDTNLDHELPFPKPTFSLGLTQEERPHPKEAVTEGETMCENAAGKEICEQEDQLGACRKSKRLKALPKSLVGQYECDMRLLNRARVAFVDPDNTGGNIDYAAKFSSLLDKLKSPFTIRIGQSTLESNDPYELVQRSSPLQPKVVDVLIGHISSQFTLNSPPNQSNHPVFMDTQFVTPIAQMFPYLLKQGGKQLMHKDARAFPIERPRSIPQNTFHAASAVSALLLVQAHAVAGVDVYKCITPDKIGSEVERLAVMFYEATVGML